MKSFYTRGLKMKNYAVIITQDEDGYYIAEVPELHGCHTQAKSLKELMERTKEAIELCLEEKNVQYPIVSFIHFKKIAV